MLEHKATGPYDDGKYRVVYPTPGCDAMTVARECRTKDQAVTEALRLNREQVLQEEAIQRERDLCGFRRIQNDLGVV